MIYIPKPEYFDSQMADAASLLYELVKYAGYKTGLFNPLDNSVAQRASPVLAALFLGSEIGIHSQLAKETDLSALCRTALYFPNELEKATNDAQYISDYLFGMTNCRQRVTARNRLLQPGDKITYEGQQYEVLKRLRYNKVQVINLSTNSGFSLSKNDGLYRSLISAKVDFLKIRHPNSATENQFQFLRKR
jgi:hypothetical protein